MLIPKYLQEISESVEISKNTEKIKIKCQCGCSHFYVYENAEQDNSIIKPGFNEIIRENDKLYLIKRNFFGKITDRIECGDKLIKKQRKIVKTKCKNCHKEYIIFDNYEHGYDAIISKIEYEDLTLENSSEFELCYSQPIEVFLKIYQDITFDEFKEEFDNLDFDAYLCSFSSIDIYGMSSKLKKIKIYSEETD